MSKKLELFSVVVPCFNEQANVMPFYQRLSKVLRKTGINYELVYVNDGSNDDTLSRLKKIASKDKSVEVINLSRNFGKEIATTAGIQHAKGQAILIIDGDGQHPPELIPEFIKKWQDGNKVVIGVRNTNSGEGVVKKYGSKLFYSLLNKISSVRAVPNSTDFRLIDSSVQEQFNLLTERSRSTRGLIDWLGFKSDYVYFDADPRSRGSAGYSFGKLMGLAINSFVSLSLKPLYFALYIGFFILPFSILLALLSATEMILGDPLNLRITGSAYLLMLMLFLVGVVLVSQGIIALYLSHIHTETQNRPLYIVDKDILD